MFKKECFKQTRRSCRSNDIKPGSQESVRCRSEICDQPVTHNDETKWLRKVERQLRGTVKQESISITNDKEEKKLRRVKNWKAPGTDGPPGYCINIFI